MPESIKALILDVDGVLVGEDSKLNFPEPNENVVNRLKSIKEKGIAISLCTSRPLYSVSGIINKAQLDNLHIGLAGAVVSDPIDNIALETHPIDPQKAKEITQVYLKNNVYTEIYGLNNYYLQKNQVRDLTARHTKIMQKEPVLVDSLIDIVNITEIYKVLPVAIDRQDQIRLDGLFKPFESDLIICWAVHPSIPSHQWGNITAKGISKRHATQRVARSLGIRTKEILGVGDGLADWQFMELCGYTAAMGNAPDDLKQLVTAHGDKGFVGKSIDENGILDIFDHYGL